MRKINEIIIHCSATIEGRDFKAKDIDKWHKERGWKGIGYHFVIDIDGTIEIGRPIEEVGAHCTSHNANSVGICYIGGLDTNGVAKDTRTDEQKKSLFKLLVQMKAMHPDAKIYSHRDFSNKECPCFNAKKEYKDI